MRQAVMAVVRSCDVVQWAEMYDQLYQLQTLLLGLYEAKYLSIVEQGNIEDLDKVKHLRRVAFDEAGGTVCSNFYHVEISNVYSYHLGSLILKEITAHKK